VFGVFPAEATVIGTFLYKNQFAAMLELAAPIALYRMLEREGEEWIGAGAFAIFFGAAVGASSRAGVMLLALELVVALTIAARRRILPWRNLLGLAGGLLLMVSVASFVAGTDSITEHFQEKSPYSVRQKLLVSTLHMIKKKPLTGYGFGTWPDIYPAYATFDSSLYANQAHNDWAQWTAEGGIPFALLLLGVVVWVSRSAVFSIWGMGLIAVMLQSFVDYPTREPVLAIFWFLLAGAVHRHEGERLLPHLIESTP
jgi:O-antigen ligase